MYHFFFPIRYQCCNKMKMSLYGLCILSNTTTALVAAENRYKFSEIAKASIKMSTIKKERDTQKHLSNPIKNLTLDINPHFSKKDVKWSRHTRKLRPNIINIQRKADQIHHEISHSIQIGCYQQTKDVKWECVNLGACGHWWCEWESVPCERQCVMTPQNSKRGTAVWFLGIHPRDMKVICQKDICHSCVCYSTIHVIQ